MQTQTTSLQAKLSAYFAELKAKENESATQDSLNEENKPSPQPGHRGLKARDVGDIIMSTYIVVIRGGVMQFEESIIALRTLGISPGARTISDLKVIYDIYTTKLLCHD